MSMQTGVDRLVEMLKEKKQMTVAQAAAELAVRKETLQTWADALQDQGIITVKYRLFDTLLLFKEDAPKKLAEQTTFLDRISPAISSLQNDTLAFEQFKSRFEQFKKELGGDFEKLQKEYAFASQYKTLTDKLTVDIVEQQKTFQRREREAAAALKVDEQIYNGLLAALKEEHKRLVNEQHRLAALKAEDPDNETVKEEEGRLQRISEEARDYEANLKQFGDTQLKPMKELVESTDKRIKEFNAVKAKAAIAQSPAYREKIVAFGDRMRRVEELISNVDKEKKQLLAALRDLHSRNPKDKAVTDGEMLLRVLEERRTKLNEKLAELSSLLAIEQQEAEKDRVERQKAAEKAALQAAPKPLPVPPPPAKKSPQPAEPFFTVTPAKAEIQAVPGKIACSFLVAHNHAGTVHPHLLFIYTSAGKTTTIPRGEWDSLGIRVHRSAKVVSEGTVYQVVLGEGKQKWDLFTSLGGPGTLKVAFTVSLATESKTLYSSANTVIRSP